MLDQREGGCDAAVDGEERAGRDAELAADEDGHRGGDVLREDLLLQQRALGVEAAEVVDRNAVRLGPLLRPVAGEDAGAADDGVGVHGVHPDPVRAELGGEQPDLVRLGGLHAPYATLFGPAKTAFFETT